MIQQMCVIKAAIQEKMHHEMTSTCVAVSSLGAILIHQVFVLRHAPLKRYATWFSMFH
jgi:hypothetical protein